MIGESKSILFLLRLWPFFGGGETVTICLANEFVKRGYKVHVLYFKETDSKNGLYIDKRVESYRIPDIRCDDLYTDETKSKEVSDFLVNYIVKKQIDLVINQWWPVSYIKDVKSCTSAKVIKCNHTAFLRPSFMDKGVKGIIKHIFKSAYKYRIVRLALKEVNAFRDYTDKYVFLSESFVNQYLKYTHGLNKEWVTSVPNPIVYENYIAPDNIEKKANEVLFVGRLVDDLKRLSIALRAWVEVEKTVEYSDWNFIVVGDGPDKNMLEEKSKSLGLRRVKFEGFQKPESYYRRAKILVQTSRYEGFGMTILEAQQCGCVPLAMDTFLTVHDLIKSGENGLIVDDSQLSFNKGLFSLMKGDNERLKMAKSAIASSHLFSIENIGNRWEQLFNSII